ncbi:hypothetical protein E2320_015695 [Naja naja]|nr:hypothetical protein E2320_015695 [Naja naja]
MSTEMAEYLRGTKLGEGSLLCTPNPTHPQRQACRVCVIGRSQRLLWAVPSTFQLGEGWKVFLSLGISTRRKTATVFGHVWKTWLSRAWENARQLDGWSIQPTQTTQRFPGLVCSLSPPHPIFFPNDPPRPQVERIELLTFLLGHPDAPVSKGERSRSPLPPPPNSKEREGERKSSGALQSATLAFDFTHTPFPAPLPPSPPNRGVGCRERRERGSLSRGRPGGLGCGPRPRAAGSLRPFLTRRSFPGSGERGGGAELSLPWCLALSLSLAPSMDL